PPAPPPCPYTTLFRSRGGPRDHAAAVEQRDQLALGARAHVSVEEVRTLAAVDPDTGGAAERLHERLGVRLPARKRVEHPNIRNPDRKSTRLNSSHVEI